MLHLKNSGYSPTDASSLLKKSRELTRDIHDRIIRDVRVSSKYLEFDISINRGDLDNLVDMLNPLGKIDHAREIIEEEKDKKSAIEDGVYYFNNERFWESHEAFEGVWKNSQEGEKDLVQGIILVAAALVHYQKGENMTCYSILGRALKKLANSTGMYHGINVDDIRERVAEMKDSKKIVLFTI